MVTKIKKIGHASISESGTINGAAGDSTRKEVCIVSNYNISRIQPYVVLHPKSEALAEASARACIAGCRNNHIGYSQSTRNTLNTYAKAVGYDLASVTIDCNTDCSAFMTVCAIAGGAKIDYGSNGPTTSTMRAKFKQSGDYDIFTSAEYTNSTELLKRGDILVREGHHTIMVLENGTETPGIPDPSETPDDTVEDEEPTEPIIQVVTPITDNSWTDQQFNSGIESIKKVYIKVNNEYKQAAVYLSNNPVILHLNKETS
jgi:hypothetical protein